CYEQGSPHSLWYSQTGSTGPYHVFSSLPTSIVVTLSRVKRRSGTFSSAIGGSPAAALRAWSAIATPNHWFGPPTSAVSGDSFASEFCITTGVALNDATFSGLLRWMPWAVGSM